MQEYVRSAINYAGMGVLAWFVAGILGWRISISQGYLSMFIKYTLLGLVVASAIGAMLISLKITIIGRIKEQNLALANIKGYPLGMIKNIEMVTKLVLL